MTSVQILVLGAIAMLFVIGWIVYGLVDVSRLDRPVAQPEAPDRRPAEKELAHR